MFQKFVVDVWSVFFFICIFLVCCFNMLWLNPGNSRFPVGHSLMTWELTTHTQVRDVFQKDMCLALRN